MNTARLRKIFNYTGEADMSNLTWFMIEELFLGSNLVVGFNQYLLHYLRQYLGHQATNVNQLFEKANGGIFNSE